MFVMKSTQLVFIYLSTTYAAQYQNYRFKIKDNAKQFPVRVFQLMRTYYEDADLRIQEMNPMRFTYEESPHFEQGYVMHEIIERYRKMAELVTRQHQRSTYVLEAIERLHEIQKIHFEIFHLVNMMHEIPLKWKDVDEFNDDKEEVHNNQIFKETQLAYEKAEKDFEKQKKKRLRALKKSRLQLLQDLEEGGTLDLKKPAKRDPYNKLWPIDYGWEIDEMPNL